MGAQHFPRVGSFAGVTLPQRTDRRTATLERKKANEYSIAGRWRLLQSLFFWHRDPASPERVVRSGQRTARGVIALSVGVEPASSSDHKSALTTRVLERFDFSPSTGREEPASATCFVVVDAAGTSHRGRYLQCALGASLSLSLPAQSL